MNKIDSLFLQALKASLNKEEVQWSMEISNKEWMALFEKAQLHHILPMIYEAVFRCPSVSTANPQMMAAYKQKTSMMVVMQVMKTMEFQQLYEHLRKAGVTPLVVKGIVCRNLYPKPDNRMSGDEDLWIAPEQFSACHEAMTSYGMTLSNPEDATLDAYEIPYGKKGSQIYIELHKSLFPPESTAYGDLNRFFTQSQERAIEVQTQGSSVFTLEYTDHLFYLICHAFKHFLHSGFGIRQVCDIILFANAYGAQIDWKRLLEQCKQIRAEKFTASLFIIGEKYLTFSPEKANYPQFWQKIDVDEQALLEDLLLAGVYGNTDDNRLHSSSITLSAVSAQNQGKKNSFSIVKTLFPSAKTLEGRFPYLKKHPILLPVAWVTRLIKYSKEINANAKTNATDSIKIGNQRVELLKEYGILEKKAKRK